MVIKSVYTELFRARFYIMYSKGTFFMLVIMQMEWLYEMYRNIGNE